jgi:small conductance mechanosensitive channel
LSSVIIPNRKIVGEILHNYGRIRQLDLSVGVAYGTDTSAALRTVDAVLAENPRVLQDPAPVTGIVGLGESSVTLAIKPWVGVKDYVVAQAEIYQALLVRFNEVKIEIPAPRTVVRLVDNRR